MSPLCHLARRPPPLRPFQLNARPFQLNSGAVRVHVSAPKPEPPRPRRFIRRDIFYESLTAMVLQSEHRSSMMARRHFHTTSRRQAFPFLGLAGLLKASTILEVIRTVGRVTLTFVPFVLFKNMVSRKNLKKVDQYQEKHPDKPYPFPPHGEETQYAEKRQYLIQGIRRRTIIFHLLIFAPFALFALAMLASIERTPLTGRWRAILLSPEEEEVIAQQLAGDGWYRAMEEILAQEGVPKLIHPSDWRYQWVYNTLRQLENIIPALGEEETLAPDWYARGDEDPPLPPPAEYPLRPRPRASEAIRLFRCSVTGEGPLPGVSSHHISGPPYSLLVIDDPESCNAFSYGFGPDGAGGIVVFSGFLDQIMRDNPCPPPSKPISSSWYSSLLGGTTPRHATPVPTPEQTADLAVLLSHELSHLVLAHHLETLSSSTVLVPGVLSIFSDVLRTLLFPFTALMGPFVNDALASLGEAGSIEVYMHGGYCTTMNQEIEADIVSARLLAYAGFDPRRAVHFWESREDQCVPGAGQSVQEERERRQLARERQSSSAMRLFGESHPINKVRGLSLRQELARWREERDRRLE